MEACITAVVSHGTVSEEAAVVCLWDVLGCITGAYLWNVSLGCVTELCYSGVCLWSVSLECFSGVCH